MALLEISRSTTLDSDSVERMHRPARSMGRASGPREPDLHNRVGPRNNPKLKVLVRSHAMREETSPPREPTPPPCINIVTTPPPALCPPQPTTAPEKSPTVRTQDSRGGPHREGLGVRDEPDEVSSCVSDTNDSSLILTSSNQKSEQEQISYSCDCFNQICAKCSKGGERNINNNVIGGGNMLSVGRAGPRHRPRGTPGSRGSADGSGSTSPCLSRDSSTEQYTDCTGIDLQQFIVDTLNKNAKDRVMMLKIEQELVTLAKDKTKSHYKFPSMSSYQRMLVHRVAAYFGMDHNIETSGKCVVVNKTRSTRVPETRFREHVREDLSLPLAGCEEPRRSILKRDSNSLEDCNYKSPDRHTGLENRRSKSFEEREEEYEKVRRRIFKDGTLQDCDSQEEFMWSEVPWPEAEPSKIRLLPPEQPAKNRLLKVQSVDTSSLLPSRPCVAKSYSFGGYGGTVSVLSRGDSVTSTHSAGPRLLTKQDSSTSTISWRLSPSSSGYKSQSQRSDSVTPSPTATPHQLSDASGKGSLEETIQGVISSEEGERGRERREEEEKCDRIVWAVTDMQSVPIGSVLIDPQTGKPFTNQDGSIYHFDPSNPPPNFTTNNKPPPSPVKLASPRKSPVKDFCHSPKKPNRSKSTHASPSKSAHRPCAPTATSATSPGPPILGPGPGAPAQHLENASNMPIQPYPAYPGGGGGGYVPPGGEGGMQLYQQPVGMVYGSYGMPQQFDNRPESAVPDLSGYFLNMSVSDGTQPVGYQQPASYWNQQPITYYQQAATSQTVSNQRYPVQLSVSNQPQGAFMSPAYPGTYLQTPPPPPGPQPPPSAPPNADLLPVYNAPMGMLYNAQQYNPNYLVQNPSPVVYAQNAVYPQGYPGYPPNPGAYPANAPTPNGNNYTASFTNPTSGQCYSQMIGYDGRNGRNHVHKGGKGFVPRVSTQYNQSQGSNHSSAGSSSPASTAIGQYFPNPNAAMGYRQCTPPETPPSQNMAFAYPPPNYMQQSMIFRPMGSIRASPPVNIRSSRSPTPAPEFSQGPPVDRGPRYSLPSALYGMGMPCIIPGDMRLVGTRAPSSVYKQPPFRPPVQPLNQPLADQANTRAHKPRKTRTKVPALPPSGRQSNHSVSTHSRF